MEYCLDLQFKIFSLGVRRTDKFWSRSSVLNINMIPSLWISGQKRPNTYFITSIKNILHWIFVLDHNKTFLSDPKDNKNIRDWNFLAKTIPRDRSRSPLGGNQIIFQVFKIILWVNCQYWTFCIWNVWLIHTKYQIGSNPFFCNDDQ